MMSLLPVTSQLARNSRSRSRKVICVYVEKYKSKIDLLTKIKLKGVKQVTSALWEIGWWR